MRGKKRPTLPDGVSVVVEILEAEEVFGNFGPQLRIKVKVVGGKYRGYEFFDYSKLTKDEKTGEIYYELGTKTESIFAAAFDAEDYSYEDDHDPGELVGKRFMSRIGLAGKNQDRNRLEYGTIGPDPNAGEDAA